MRPIQIGPALLGFGLAALILLIAIVGGSRLALRGSRGSRPGDGQPADPGPEEEPPPPQGGDRPGSP